MSIPIQAEQKRCTHFYSQHVLTSKYFIPELITRKTSEVRKRDVRALRFLFTSFVLFLFLLFYNLFVCFLSAQIQIFP